MMGNSNFRRSSYSDRNVRQIRNLVTKPGVLFVPPFLSKPRQGQSRRQLTEIRVVAPIDESTGAELSLFNDKADDKMILRDKLAETFANLEVVRQLGGPPGGLCTDMVTSVRDDAVGNTVRGGWTPYYEMRQHLTRKILQQRDRYMLGLTIDIPKAWIEWHNTGKFAFGFLPQACGRAYQDRDKNEHPEQYLIKCVALTVNGESKAANGKSYTGPAVFMVPPSASSSFLATITEVTFADRALSADNNRFGDFVTLENGHPIEMVRNADGRNYTLRLSPVKLPMTAAEARALDVPWSELVVVPSIEESIQWIAQSIGDPVAVAFGLRKRPSNPYGGDYEKYLPSEWLKLAKDIDDELPKETFEKMMAGEIEAMKNKAAASPAPAPGAVPRPLSFEELEKMRLQALEGKTGVSSATPAKPAVTGGFRPAPKPKEVDEARYDQALAKMQQQMAAEGAETMNPDAEGEEDNVPF